MNVRKCLSSGIWIPPRKEKWKLRDNGQWREDVHDASSVSKQNVRKRQREIDRQKADGTEAGLLLR